MRAARLIRMALLVQAHSGTGPGLTAAELARALDVSRRTVIRDAQALQDAGIPLTSGRGRGGGYRIAPGHRSRLTSLNPTEAETLYLSGLPTALSDLGLADAAGTARLKLSAGLLPSLRTAAESTARRFHLDAPAWFHDRAAPPLLPELARATWADHSVHLTYTRRPTTTVTRLLEPHGLVLKAGVWYVVGRVDGDWRTYRVDRLTTLTPGDPFTRDPAFDLAAHWQASAQDFARALLRTTVTVRVTPEGLRRLPDAVDPAGAGDLRAGPAGPDGRTTLDVPVESEEIAFHQLAGLGADVEVLAPESLRTRFHDHAQALAALYGRRNQR